MICSTGKICHDTREEAENALIENHIHFHHKEESGPKNVYLCRDCGAYHFTSQGEMSQVLEDNMAFIKAQRRARDWENKLR